MRTMTTPLKSQEMTSFPLLLGSQDIPILYLRWKIRLLRYFNLLNYILR